MTRRAVRLTLLMVFLAAVGVTAYLFWTADQQARGLESSARRFDDRARAAELRIDDLRAAQQACVATGQGQDFWIKQTAAVLADVRSRLHALESDAAPGEATASLDQADGAMQDFQQMDARAREYLRAGQLTFASDLIFADGLDLTHKAAAGVEAARVATRADRDAAVDGMRRRQLFSVGAAAATAVLIVLLLLPAGSATEPAVDGRPIVPSIAAPPDPVAAALDDSMAEGWRPARTVEDVPAPAVEAVAALDFTAVASLCGELARVVDTGTLQGLLARVAAILDATGIIIWISDPDGTELNPILAHGYSAAMITRLGTIKRDASNVTAAALRTGLTQVVNGDAVSNGAVAAPIVTPGGCAGVMAAELRQHGERQDVTLAAAGIIAAQLATLLGPPLARPQGRAELGA
ncbi:MAG TPA: hypothetical protein VFX12_09480 [Vicinamibacterales bacterium]|nr:hypothetical protein [Vicinamibacterales bacterium]